jgi:Holliday junction resolvasome RuvABC ATP-dependent DNA helicase subunit
MSSTSDFTPTEDTEQPAEAIFTVRDQLLDSSLRPKSFDEYIGQNLIKQNLQILLQAAKERQ